MVPEVQILFVIVIIAVVYLFLSWIGQLSRGVGDRMKTEVTSNGQLQSGEELPSIAMPSHWYPLLGGQIPTSGFDSALEEQIISQYGHFLSQDSEGDISVAMFAEPPDKGIKRTVVACYQPNNKIRFIGWIVITRRGPLLDWKLYASEIRAFKTPRFEDSHFAYGSHQHERYNQTENGTGLVTAVWDAAFSNLTTDEVAKQAAWFKSLLASYWTVSCQSALSRDRIELSGEQNQAGWERR
ncbi:MAG: hypothetical protein WCK51_15845 [Armatimonadota bacterium]